ncbi:MAG: pyridoxal phosphate-dependent decarboxylase family protein [Chlorobiota bacterium]
MNLDKLFSIIDKELNKDYTKSEVLNYKDPDDLTEILNLEINRNGSESEFYKSIDNYLVGSVDTSHPLFSNQLWAGRNQPGLIAEFITSLRNTSVYTYETAPAATLIEKYMIKVLTKQMGFENGDGTFLTGSSNANLVSLLVARNTIFPEIKNKGLSGLPELCFFVSEHAHYSFEKAANVLGFGEQNVIKVKADENHRIIPKDLENKINSAIDEGKKPFYVCGTAGTTEVGAFDPLIEMQDIANKYNLWFHTDAAWGGALAFSDKHKDLLNGIGKSDSISWDAHKLMGIPLICSVILLKDNNQLLKSVHENTSDYLFHDHEHDDLDLGKKSIQCGRRVDSLKLWLSFKYYGFEGYENRINKMYSLSQYMTNRIKENENFELLAPTSFCNINFRFNPRNLEEESLNSLNLKARDNIYKSGKALFNYVYLSEIMSIRYIIANADIDENTIDEVLGLFENECIQLLNNH